MARKTTQADETETTDQELSESQFKAMYDGYDTYEEYINSTDKLDVIPGFSLVKPDDLEGEPFVITGITFRPSGLSDRGYVSVEIMARDAGRVVVNDGSTGIRRQLLTWCLSKGLARPLERDNGTMPDGDASHTNFDWQPPCESRFDTNGDLVVRVSGLRLHAPRGTRVSRYEWQDDDGKMRPGYTWYLG